MLNEIILGLWKMGWFIVPLFGTLIVGGLYEHFKKLD